MKLAVIDTGTFDAAAGVLHVTPSAVSQRIVVSSTNAIQPCTLISTIGVTSTPNTGAWSRTRPTITSRVRSTTSRIAASELDAPRISAV